MFSADVYGSWQKIQKEKFSEMKRMLGPLAQQIFHKKLVLDVGCGSGYLERSFEGSFIGIDTDVNMLHGAGFSRVRGDGSLMPFGDESFDSVVSIDAMHLIEGSDFIRVLKPGGLAMLSIFFNDENYQERKAMLREKTKGLEVIMEMDITGCEKEYVLVAVKR